MVVTCVMLLYSVRASKKMASEWKQKEIVLRRKAALSEQPPHIWRSPRWTRQSRCKMQLIVSC